VRRALEVERADAQRHHAQRCEPAGRFQSRALHEREVAVGDRPQGAARGFKQPERGRTPGTPVGMPAYTGLRETRMADWQAHRAQFN
jgi:hypothetical protein